MKTIDEQISIISQGTVEIVGIDDLIRKLERAVKTDVPLKIKLGFDPTAPDIHLGHAVVLHKIRQIQDLGHMAVIIIGDFTARIGDPTGRSKTRRQLSSQEVTDNAETYERQIFKILNKEKTEIRLNSEWLSELRFDDVIRLASKCTVARILERNDFHNRFSAHESIGVHEFFYPLMQGYDSVMIKADVELGGTDQRFNILMGRELQKDHGQESQAAIFMPILEGVDGKEKMSKSLGNCIGINEKPNDMYGKVMSIPDNLIARYFELAADMLADELADIRKALGSADVNPRDIKMKLAKKITALYHGTKESGLAEEHFRTVFQKHDIPDNAEEFMVPADITVSGETDMVKLLVKSGYCKSGSEARRLIIQGAVKVNGYKSETFKFTGLRNGDIVQIGKFRIFRAVIQKDQASFP